MFRQLLISAVIVIGFSVLPVVVALWPSDQGPVAVLFTDDAVSVMSEAGGRILTTSDDRRSLVTQAPRDETPGFVARLLRRGARFVVAAPSAVGCTITPQRTFSSTTDPEG
ncbi:MAG: hypothetical protein GX458_14210 [Phyllobacteriaceae bacterium]|nr:hypothetical protein [Phyllobacteriaceae bacterium]